MGNEREWPAEGVAGKKGKPRRRHGMQSAENYLRISSHGAIFKFENKSETKRGRSAGWPGR